MCVINSLSDGAVSCPHNSYDQFPQVFDRIRIFVDDESDKLTKNSEHVEVCDDSALLATAAKEFDDVPADPDPDPDSNTTSSSSAGDASAIADTGIGSGHEESLSPVPDNSVTVPDDDKEQEPKDIFHPAAFYDVMQEDSRHPSEADLESWIILQVSHTASYSTLFHDDSILSVLCLLVSNPLGTILTEIVISDIPIRDTF